MAEVKSSRTHIIKRKTNWAVIREGAKRASGLFPTKVEAIKKAKEQITPDSSLIVHSKDGSIEKWIKGK